MATEAHGPTASEYIVHHLQHLQNVKQKSIVDFSVLIRVVIQTNAPQGLLQQHLTARHARQLGDQLEGVGEREQQSNSHANQERSVDQTGQNEHLGLQVVHQLRLTS
jgi:hypothetical protein